MKTFATNGKPSKAAPHGLGLARANRVTEATRRKLHVYMMIGLDPGAARETFSIPEDVQAYTAMAIGYRATGSVADPRGFNQRFLKCG